MVVKRAVQAIYRDAINKVRVSNEYSDEFRAQVEVHQGLVFSLPYSYKIIVEDIVENDIPSIAN